MFSGWGLNNNNAWDESEGVMKVSMMVWDTGTLAWTKYSGTASGGVAANVNVTNFPSSPATSTLQSAGNTSAASIDTKLSSQATAANQTTIITDLGGVTETAPTTDTASSGLNGRLQRLAQKLTAGLPPNTDITVTGTTTNVADVVTISTSGLATVGFTTTGTWVGTHIIEGSNDGGVTYNTTYGLARTTAAALFTTVTTNLVGFIAVSGFDHIRFRRSIATSGVATISFTGNVTPHMLHVFSTVPANLQATVSMLTLTKGTQGATGVTVQNLKDAGRNVTNYFMALPVVTSATDALVSLTGYKGGAAVGATATPAVVTTAKIYRITSISITYVAIATAGTVAFTLRANTGGVVAISSPAVCTWVSGAPAATAGVSQTYDIVIPDGLEFAAGTGIGVSMLGLGATQASAIVGYGQIAINGYEY